MSTEAERLLRHLWVVLTSNQDHGRVGVLPDDLLGQEEARLARHVDVAEGEVEGAGGKLLAGLLDIARELTRVAFSQRAIDYVQHLGPIVCHQDPRDFGGPRRVGALRQDRRLRRY